MTISLIMALLNGGLFYCCIISVIIQFRSKIFFTFSFFRNEWFNIPHIFISSVLIKKIKKQKHHTHVCCQNISCEGAMLFCILTMKKTFSILSLSIQYCTKFIQMKIIFYETSMYANIHVY